MNGSGQEGGWRRATAPVLVLVLVLAAGACSPALNWREVRVDAGGLLALFPCRPDRMGRTVSVDGVPLQMELLSCNAAGLSFALAHAAAPDGADGVALLAALRAAQARNVDGRETSVASAAVASGAVPVVAQRVGLEGRRADGKRLDLQVQFFGRGRHLFQASVLGPAASLNARSDNAPGEFFDAMRLGAAVPAR